MKRYAKMMWLVILGLSVIACQKDVNTGAMSIRMKDAPGDFEHVNIEVELVQIHYAGGVHGWVNLGTESGIYDLLELQNGINTTLVNDEEIPAGKVTQMRLILGDDNWVVVDSVGFPLELSSQDETGLKLNLDMEIAPEDTVDILFDFDVEHSIHLDGTGSYKLKPVLKLESVTQL